MIVSLDQVLAGAGIRSSSAEVEAYLREDIARGMADPDRLENGLFIGQMPAFRDQAQEQLFLRLFRELFWHLRASYDPDEDQVVGSLRGRALWLAREDLEWIRSVETLGLSPRETPSAELAAVGEHARSLSPLLAEMNRLTDSVLEAEQEAKIRHTLGLYEDTSREIRGRAERKIHRVMERHRRSLYRRGGRRKPRAMLILRVTLRRIQPPIWRRIVVPDSYTLLQLHGVIQEAMGWTDSHLHLFEIGQIVYSDPENDEYGESNYADEKRFRLSVVLPRPGRIFGYEYDFGDSWEHTVKVDTLVAVDPDAPAAAFKPGCIGGLRACPPEDCGGVRGYRDVLAAFRRPEAGRTEEMRQTVRWLGSWEPERFDVLEANRRIKALFG